MSLIRQGSLVPPAGLHGGGVQHPAAAWRDDEQRPVGALGVR